MERRGDANFCCISNDNINFFENEEDALEFIYERSIENAKQWDNPDVNPFSGGYIFPLDLEVTNTSCLLLSSDHVNFHHDNRPKSDLALEVFLHGSENPWTSHGKLDYTGFDQRDGDGPLVTPCILDTGCTYSFGLHINTMKVLINAIHSRNPNYIFAESGVEDGRVKSYTELLGISPILMNIYFNGTKKKVYPFINEMGNVVGVPLFKSAGPSFYVDFYKKRYCIGDSGQVAHYIVNDNN
jgi:hypothetical protein